MATRYERRFGEIAGHPEGTWYPSREDVRIAGLHAHERNGISGTGKEGADAIVLSGGYDDDVDYGDVIIYTGHGGQVKGRQVADQNLDDPGNAGLVKSQLDKLPVRVIRGSKAQTKHSPTSGYKYDGLYQVNRHWYKPRNDGFYVCRFHMSKIGSSYGHQDTEPLAETDILSHDDDTEELDSPYERVLSARIRRHIKAATKIKELHSNICQICGNTVSLPLGPRSEAAHIRPLGFPHNGPDIESNMLCLCPNDHLRFDNGALYITDELKVVDALNEKTIGGLRKHPRHPINLKHISYHRECWKKDGGWTANNPNS